MPHIIIEYSNNFPDLDVKELMEDCHGVLDGMHNVTQDRIKTRAIILDDFLVGTAGNKGQMIHVQLKLMTGRSVEARAEMSKILADVVRKHIPINEYPTAAITVEVSELDKATYIP